jgi:hypothetical protein
MVANLGGRLHTFTPVAQFGGGRVPPLNIGLTVAPECASTAFDVAPGDRLELSGLSAGNHRYQCCIHPWMRAMVKVGYGQERRETGDRRQPLPVACLLLQLRPDGPKELFRKLLA